MRYKKNKKNEIQRDTAARRLRTERLGLRRRRRRLLRHLELLLSPVLLVRDRIPSRREALVHPALDALGLVGFLRNACRLLGGLYRLVLLGKHRVRDPRVLLDLIRVRADLELVVEAQAHLVKYLELVRPNRARRRGVAEAQGDAGRGVEGDPLARVPVLVLREVNLCGDHLPLHRPREPVQGQSLEAGDERAAELGEGGREAGADGRLAVEGGGGGQVEGLVAGGAAPASGGGAVEVHLGGGARRVREDSL